MCCLLRARPSVLVHTLKGAVVGGRRAATAAGTTPASPAERKSELMRRQHKAAAAPADCTHQHEDPFVGQDPSALRLSARAAAGGALACARSLLLLWSLHAAIGGARRRLQLLLASLPAAKHDSRSAGCQQMRVCERARRCVREQRELPESLTGPVEIQQRAALELCEPRAVLKAADLQAVVARDDLHQTLGGDRKKQLFGSSQQSRKVQQCGASSSSLQRCFQHELKSFARGEGDAVEAHATPEPLLVQHLSPFSAHLSAPQLAVQRQQAQYVRHELARQGVHLEGGR